VRIASGFLGNDRTIDPDFNSLGHRCPEVTEVLGQHLTFKKYFLVIGDNAGLHMHKPVAETWPHLLHHGIQHNYYNLSIINGGIDATRYNLAVWLAKYIKPKAIFVASDWANAFYNANYNKEEIKEADNISNIAGYHNSRRELFSAWTNVISKDIPFYQLLNKNDTPMIEGDHVVNIYTDLNNDQAVCDQIVEMFESAKRAVSV
jgi:hypothetical protein